MTSPELWPALPFPEWEATCDTVHMWSQIVGKTRLALTPLENHWWNAALYVTPRGLTTSSIPYPRGAFSVDFDFVGHHLAIRTSNGAGQDIPLFPRSVADFYFEYMACLQSLGIEVRLDRMPCEFDDQTRFDQDRHHASYQKEYVESFHQILINIERVLKKFRASFIGKCSPVHFFWGSFDLAVTRFSGKRAPVREDADAITKEAYSHEVISCGFWPGDRRFPHAAFYAYAAPSPAGLSEEPVRPAAAYWNPQLSEFILKYDDVRVAPSPEQAILDFCQSAYETGSDLGKWNRAELERG